MNARALLRELWEQGVFVALGRKQQLCCSLKIPKSEAEKEALQQLLRQEREALVAVLQEEAERQRTALELFLFLLEKGVILSSNGEKIQCRAPEGSITAILWEVMREYKRELLTLLPPTPLIKAERRRAPRKAVGFQVLYIDTRGRPGIGMALNLSPGGMFIQDTHSSLPVGTILITNFVLPTRFVCKLKAKVVHTNLVGSGLQFIDTHPASAESWQNLKAYCALPDPARASPG